MDQKLTTIIVATAATHFTSDTSIDGSDAEEEITDADKSIGNRFSQHRHDEIAIYVSFPMNKIIWNTI